MLTKTSILKRFFNILMIIRVAIVFNSCHKNSRILLPDSLQKLIKLVNCNFGFSLKVFQTKVTFLPLKYFEI